ncbi:hypothetical protein LJD49_29710, partial [Escherichia coli]|nr:hypothetical protein [Escherichia coli]
RARIGQAPRAPLEFDRERSSASAARGGLVVVGSHVGVTSRQLAQLVSDRPDAAIVEIDVPSILDATTAEAAVAEAVARVVAALADGDV